MSDRRPKNLALILAREFASNLATPMFLADSEGNLVFYNEPAEEILGKTYAEAGEMPAAEWGTLFSPEGPDGEPLALEDMPAGIALQARRPAHGAMRITGLDGEKRLIVVTAFPLFGWEQEFLGAVAIFWEQS